MNRNTRDLIVFFVATFAWTWGFYTPLAISGNSPYQMPWMILLILGGAGPSIVGVVMILLTYSKEQRREFWSRSFSLKRIPMIIWLVIFLIFPLLSAVCATTEIALGGIAPGMEQFINLMANPVMWPLAVFISFMSGPWSEEFGWRGYVLEPMIERFKVIPASIILGVIWGVWHLPLFFVPATWFGQIGFGLSGLWMFIGGSVGLALLMSWVYMHTSRSILSGMLMHFTYNFTSQLIAPASPRFDVTRAILVIALGLVFTIWVSRRAGTDRQPTVSAPQPG